MKPRQYSDFYTANSVEEVLMEASSINLREEVLELAGQLKDKDSALDLLEAVQQAFTTLKQHYETGN